MSEAKPAPTKFFISTRDKDYSDAAVCRMNGWVAGTRLVGDEGYGPTVIEITAIGEQKILAKEISRNGLPEPNPEMLWTLSWREWKKVSDER